MLISAHVVLTAAPEKPEDLETLFELLCDRFVDGEVVAKDSSAVIVSFTRQEQVV